MRLLNKSKLFLKNSNYKDYSVALNAINVNLSKVEGFSLLVFVSIFFIGIFTFFPGAMTWDSLDQLRQAREGQYSNWQPPIMAILWNQFLVLPYGEGGMLIFHLFCLYSSCIILFFWAKQRSYKARFIFLLIPVLPWVVNFEFAIWKDVGLAFSWLLAIALTLTFKPKRHIGQYSLMVVVFSLFLYGLLVRSNALFAAFALLPFLVLCTYKFSLIKTFIISSCSIALLFFTLPNLIIWGFDVTPQNNLSYIMLDDVVALRKDNDNFFSKEEMLKIEQCGIRKQNKVGVAFCLEQKFLFVKDQGYEQLKAEWLLRIQSEPFKYIKYRLSAFSTLLRIPAMDPYYPAEFRVRQAPYIHESPIAEKEKLAISLARYIKSIRGTISFIYKPYFWAVISAVLVFLLFKLRRFNPYPLYLLPISGLMYLLGYILTTPFPDFRYVYWTCIIATFSMIMALCLWQERRNLSYIESEAEGISGTI